MAGSRRASTSAAAADMDGRGDDVVRRLPAVHVIVRVRAGEVGDHLVGVHVGGGAAAGLEDVHHKLSVEIAAGDAFGGAAMRAARSAGRWPSCALRWRRRS